LQKSGSSRWLGVLAGALTLLAAAVLVWVLTRPWGDGDNPAPSPRGEPTLLPPFKGSIDARVWAPKPPRRQWMKLHEPEALPLRVDDEIRILVQLNRPGYLYVLWIDSEGKVQPVYPWQEGNWTKRPKQEEPRKELNLPQDDGIYRNQSAPAGMETLALLVSAKRLPEDVSLPELLGELGPQTLADPKEMAWFENGRLVLDEPGRAPTLKSQTSDNPVIRTQQRFQKKVGRLFDYTRAVSFANLGS
jgi:hypothetical protein